MRKFVFLDYDGVLTSERIRRERGGVDFDSNCVKLLNLIPESVHIIVTSTYRIGRSSVDLREMLVPYGLTRRINGKTRMVDNYGCSAGTSRISRVPIQRGTQIAETLDAEINTYKFAIIDDSSDMWDLAPWLVHVSPEAGLQEEHIAKVMQLLESGPEISHKWSNKTHCPACKKYSHNSFMSEIRQPPLFCGGELEECYLCSGSGFTFRFAALDYFNQNIHKGKLIHE